MDNLFDILIELIALIIAGLLLSVGEELKRWIKEQILKVKDERLQKLIVNLVHSVEQTLKEQDPTGAKRFAEVERLLEDAGYAITDVIRSMIEAEVYNINLNNKK